MDREKYSVVLNVLPDSPYFGLLEQFCGKIFSTESRYLLYLRCSKIDNSHPIYLEVVAHKRIDAEILEEYKLWVPHVLVLMISDLPADPKSLGFVQA